MAIKPSIAAPLMMHANKITSVDAIHVHAPNRLTVPTNIEMILESVATIMILESKDSAMIVTLVRSVIATSHPLAPTRSHAKRVARVAA